MTKKDRIRVLHFTKVINTDDFIDTIIRFSDQETFQMMACTYTTESNIRKPDYTDSEIPFFQTNTEETKSGFVKAIFKLSKILKKEKPDILHTHHYYESLIGAAAIYLSGLNIKLVVGRHYDEELYVTTKGLKLKLYLWLEAIFNKAAARIISPSSKISALLKKQRVPDQKISLVPYGFDFSSPKYQLPEPAEIAAKRTELGVPEDHLLVGNFGRHHKIKGQEFLLMGFSDFISEHPDATLLMVGDGPAHEDLKSFARDLNIDKNVLFTGWQRDLRLLISACDLVVHPTLQEAFPQIMIESMALEKPLLITPVSGATDQIEEGKTGFFIPFSDPVSIANKLAELKASPEFAAQVGKNARQYVIKSLDIRNIIVQYQNVYLSILK